MQTVIIAAAPTDRNGFSPVYAEFPIRDRVLLECMGSQIVTEGVMKAACKMLGIDSRNCVTGMYYVLPERENRPFANFLADLEKRYHQKRYEMQQEQLRKEAERRAKIFKVIVKL